MRYESYPEIKDTKRIGWEVNNFCEGGNTVVSSILPFHLFLHLKKHVAGQKFHEEEEVKNEVNMWLRAQEAEFSDIGIQKLVPRVDKCIDKGGDYVEK